MSLAWLEFCYFLIQSSIYWRPRFVSAGGDDDCSLPPLNKKVEVNLDLERDETGITIDGLLTNMIFKCAEHS